MRRLSTLLALAVVATSCGGGDADVPDGDSQSSTTVAATTTLTQPAEPTTTTLTETVEPAANVLFSGALTSTATVSGTLSFTVTESGQIEELNLDAALTNFDCGGGKTLSSSGAATYFFPDPIVIRAGRFSTSGSSLDWDGQFDSPTTAHGSIRIDAGVDCGNRPPSVTWTATANG